MPAPRAYGRGHPLIQGLTIAQQTANQAIATRQAEEARKEMILDDRTYQMERDKAKYTHDMAMTILEQQSREKLKLAELQAKTAEQAAGARELPAIASQRNALIQQGDPRRQAIANAQIARGGTTQPRPPPTEKQTPAEKPPTLTPQDKAREKLIDIQIAEAEDFITSKQRELNNAQEGNMSKKDYKDLLETSTREVNISRNAIAKLNAEKRKIYEDFISGGQQEGQSTQPLTDEAIGQILQANGQQVTPANIQWYKEKYGK